ncbi:MAG: DNA polymerase III subunit delta [Rickettsiales bacterium]|jgi:DNA polymerase-3 subunit delta|nr:DNA polymerase III subunit delta [Rickettsiales bacterium]
MKIYEKDFNAAIAGVRGILIFGPDAGQVDEFADRAAQKLEISPDNLYAIEAGELKEKSDALFAEACSPSFFGGRKMVLVANARDGDSATLTELCAAPGLDAFVVITADNLTAGGKLRAFAENAKDFACLACYADSADGLAALIQKDLFATNSIKRIDPDAMQYMCVHLGGDRGIVRSFLKKIAIYCDGAAVVSLADVEKCLPDTGAMNVDEFVYSLTAGYMQQTLRAMDRIFFEMSDYEHFMILSALTRHFRALLNDVSGGISPRVFYKWQSHYDAARRIWEAGDLVSVLDRLAEIETQSRTTKIPLELLLRDFALKLVIKAAKMAIRKRGR